MTIKGYRTVSGFMGTTKKCGHDIPIEEYLADHKHDDEDGYPYCYCRKCQTWVSIEGPDDAGDTK